VCSKKEARLFGESQIQKEDIEEIEEIPGERKKTHRFLRKKKRKRKRKSLQRCAFPIGRISVNGSANKQLAAAV
jgi:hypothetical protein